MIKRKRKTIGILGGMGPEATARFFELIIKNTEAACDQEHLRIIVVNQPETPDRTKAVLYGGKNPLPYLLKGLKILEKAGAELVAVPCLTAHYFFPELRNKTKLKLINLIEESARWIKNNLQEVNSVGLLATEGTIASGLFQKALSCRGFDLVIPSPDTQKLIMKAIYGNKGIKAGFLGVGPTRLLKQAAKELIQIGAEAIIAGCTEIPLVLKPGSLPVPLVDPMVIGARVLIIRAGARLKESPVS
jgi:aspartate racemase